MKYWSIWKITVISAVLGLLAFGISFLVPQTYESEQSLYFPQAQANSKLSPFLGLGILSSISGSMGAPPSAGDSGDISQLGGAMSSPLIGSGAQTALAILNSYQTLADVLTHLGIADDYGVNMARAVENFRKKVYYEVDVTGVLIIHARAHSPEMAAKINSAIYEELQHRSAELTVDVSDQNYKYVQKRLADAEASLASIGQASKGKIAGTSFDQGASLIKAYYGAVVQLQDAQANQATDIAKYHSLEGLYQDALAGSANDPENLAKFGLFGKNYEALVAELMNRQVALKDAISQFQATSPDVKLAQQRALSMQTYADRLTLSAKKDPMRVGNPDLLALKASVESSSVGLQEAANFLAKLKAEIDQLPGEYVLGSTAKAEFEDALKQVTYLRHELDLADIARSRDPDKFVQIDQPTVDPKPVFPVKWLVGLVVFLVAFLGFSIPKVFGTLNEKRKAELAEQSH